MDETHGAKARFSITVTDSDGGDQWVIQCNVSCKADQLCAMSSAAIAEVNRIHSEHHVNVARSN